MIRAGHSGRRRENGAVRRTRNPRALSFCRGQGPCGQGAQTRRNGSKHVHNPRTGKPIDDVTLRLRFPEELCQAKAKVSLILGTSLLGKVKAGDNGALGMLARNHRG